MARIAASSGAPSPPRLGVARARRSVYVRRARRLARARSWRRTPLEYVTTTDRYIDE
jgi:hypothetical protein